MSATRRFPATRWFLFLASLLCLSSLAQPAFAASPRSLDVACPPDSVPSVGFYDTDGTTFLREIDCAVTYGLATGVSQTHFAPRDTVTRGQMATFLVNLLDAADHAPPPQITDRFTDDDGSTHEANIDRLAAEGIVSGYGDGTFRPTEPVTRAQMASFVYRTLLAVGVEADAATDVFTDDDGSVHEPAIDALVSLGVVTGVGPATYDPEGLVRREQMAAFLARSVDLLVEEGIVPPAYASGE
jgi:hypothetical protein